MDFVKKKMPKNVKPVVGNAKLKTAFPNASIDKTVIGVKFKGENVIYDFSLNGLLDSKKEELRSVVTKALWGE